VALQFAGLELSGLELDEVIPLTVRVLLWPAVMDEGLKEQLAPPADEQVSEMLLKKELGADALTVKVVESVPITTIADRALAEREKSGFPVPVSETLCGLLAASSVTLRLPVRLPLAVFMLRNFFITLPKDLIEAARMDGATIGRELVYVLTPMAIPGLASTLLLNFNSGSRVRAPASPPGSLRSLLR